MIDKAKHRLSLTHGTPSHIGRETFDVPVPSIDLLAGQGASPAHLHASEIFLALLRLTEVLGLYLGHIYRVNTSHPAAAAATRSLARTVRKPERGSEDRVRYGGPSAIRRTNRS